MPTAEQILKLLDEAAAEHQFPMLDNGYIYPVDVRLHAYADETRWALLIEASGTSVRAWSFDNYVQGFGNCLIPSSKKENFANEQAWRQWLQNHADKDMWIVSPVENDGLFDDEGEEEVDDENHPRYHCNMPLRTGAQQVIIRDQVIPLPSVSEIAAAGVEIEHPPYIQFIELMRWAAAKHRDLLLATDEELHTMVPAALPLLLRLDEWWHPDLVNKEMPSQTETFRMIAEVIATRDASKYRAPAESNTHWSNWPDGGTL